MEQYDENEENYLPLCYVTFRTFLVTEPNEQVRVVGSTSKLGKWDPYFGVDLVRALKSQVWYTSIPIELPIQKSITYKYVVFGSDNKFKRWESFVGNRIVVPTGVSMVVEDDAGVGRNLLTDPSTASVSSHHQTKHQHASKETVQELADVVHALNNSELLPSMFNNLLVIVAAFELPLKVVRSEYGQDFSLVTPKASSILSQLHSLRNTFQMSMKFVGWPGIVVKSSAEEQKIEELLEAHDCIPVFIEQSAVQQYMLFLSEYLSPLFHNVFVLTSKKVRKLATAGWNTYQHVNRLYAEVIARQVQQTDAIWVHDFPLLLLPQFVNRRIRGANVGLFLHCPFPSSELFRCLPIREELLRGMLFSDLIGFNFFEYARNFLVITKRLLGIDHRFRIGGFLELEYGGRYVMLRVGHGFIPFREIEQNLRTNSKIQKTALEIRQLYKNSFIAVSIDTPEPLSGLMLKLRSFRLFLQRLIETNKAGKKLAVLIQYIRSPDYCCENDVEKALSEELAFAKSVNEEFGRFASHPLIIIEKKKLTDDEKHGVFYASDLYFNTSIRDSLNLDAFEFICSHKQQPAAVVLSEFTGSSHILASPIRVNPFNVEAVTEALLTVVTSPLDERNDHFSRDLLYLERNSTFQWAEEFIIDLHRARKRDNLTYVSWGFGTSYRVLGMDTQFQYLDCNTVVLAFRAAKRRVFFLDHEGTLAQDRRMITAVPGMELLTAMGSAPSVEIRQCLTTLCNAGVTVVILSGRDRSLLGSWFVDIPDVGLCAEHGFYYKLPMISGDHWKCLSKTTDFTWKTIASQLMNQYVKRTQGAFIENKGSALVFQYRDADPDFGDWQAKELSNSLTELLFGYPVTVVRGKGYVEVKLSGVNKGQAVETLLEKLYNISPIDFILCIGDDRSDEDMFPVVNSFFESRGLPNYADGEGHPQQRSKCRFSLGTELQKNIYLGGSNSVVKRKSSVFEQKHLKAASPLLPVAFSVTVGKKPSNAKNFLNDVEDVYELLQSLACDKFSTAFSNDMQNTIIEQNIQIQ